MPPLAKTRYLCFSVSAVVCCVVCSSWKSPLAKTCPPLAKICPHQQKGVIRAFPLGAPFLSRFASCLYLRQTPFSNLAVQSSRFPCCFCAVASRVPPLYCSFASSCAPPAGKSLQNWSWISLRFGCTVVTYIFAVAVLRSLLLFFAHKLRPRTSTCKNTAFCSTLYTNLPLAKTRRFFSTQVSGRYLCAFRLLPPLFSQLVVPLQKPPPLAKTLPHAEM